MSLTGVLQPGDNLYCRGAIHAGGEVIM